MALYGATDLRETLAIAGGPSIASTAMNLDPRDTVDTPATNPNRGMSTRPYMLIVIVALLLLLLVAIVFIFVRRGTGTPQSSPGAPTTSSLAEPASVHTDAHAGLPA